MRSQSRPVWDDTQGVDPAGSGTNTKGYAMSAFKLETYAAVDTTDPVVVLTTPVDGATYEQGDVVTVDYACSDLESGIASCDGTAPDGSALDTSTLGTGIEFTVTSFNGAGLSTVVTHSYDIVEAVPGGTVEVSVNQSSDDAEESDVGGAIDLASTDLELVVDGTDEQLVGLRFQGVSVPAGATVTNAYLEFETDETNNLDPSRLTISGEDADDPLTFTATAGDISGRTQTAAEVVWLPDAWSAVDATHQTPDIAWVVQEIIDRGGWTSGNAMAFIIEGEGRRVAESWDGEAAAAPLLHVEYVTSPVPLVASFEQGVDGYGGTVDTYLNSLAGDTSYATASPLMVDLSPERHILMRFDDVFGSGAGQVPVGSVIQSASLEVDVTNASTTGTTLHRMLQGWSDADTWNLWGGGIQADGSEAAAVSESGTHGSAVGASSIDVTADLQAWSDGATNNGWVFLPPAPDDSWQFGSSESATPPVLMVKYFVPVTVPSIGVSGTPLSEFSSEPGVASDVQSYSVGGSDLTGDIVVTAPTDFEVSLSSDAGFGSAVTLFESGGSVVSTPVFVRMNRATEGTPSGDISHVSAGAATVNVAVSGSVVPPPRCCWGRRLGLMVMTVWVWVMCRGWRVMCRLSCG